MNKTHCFFVFLLTTSNLFSTSIIYAAEGCGPDNPGDNSIVTCVSLDDTGFIGNLNTNLTVNVIPLVSVTNLISAGIALNLGTDSTLSVNDAFVSADSIAISMGSGSINVIQSNLQADGSVINIGLSSVDINDSTLSGAGAGIQQLFGSDAVINISNGSNIDSDLAGINVNENADITITDSSITSQESIIADKNSVITVNNSDLTGITLNSEQANQSTLIIENNSTVTSILTAINLTGSYTTVDISDSTLNPIGAGIDTTNGEGNNTITISNSNINTGFFGIRLGNNETVMINETTIDSNVPILGGSNNTITLDTSIIIGNDNAINLGDGFDLTITDTIITTPDEDDNAVILANNGALDITTSTISAGDKAVIIGDGNQVSFFDTDVTAGIGNPNDINTLNQNGLTMGSNNTVLLLTGTAINADDDGLVVNGSGNSIELNGTITATNGTAVILNTPENETNNFLLQFGGTVNSLNNNTAILGGIGDETITVTLDGFIDGNTVLLSGDDTFIGLGNIDSVLLGDGNDEFHIFTSANLIGGSYQGGTDGGSDILRLDGAGNANLNFNNIIEFESWITQGGGQWTVGGTNSFVDAQLLSSQLILDSSSDVFLSNGISIEDSLLYVNGQLGSDQTTVTFNIANDTNSQVIVGPTGMISSNSNNAILGNANANYIEINAGGVIQGDVNLSGGSDTAIIAGALQGALDLGEGDDSVSLYTTGSLSGITGGSGMDSLTLLGAGPGSFDFGNSTGLETWSTQGGDWTVAGGQVGLDYAELLNGNLALNIDNLVIQDGFSIKGSDNSLTINGTLQSPNNPAITFDGSGDNNQLTIAGSVSSNTQTAILGDEFRNLLTLKANAQVLGDTLLLGGNDNIQIETGAAITGLLDTGAGNDIVTNKGILNNGVSLGEGGDTFIQFTSGTFTNLQAGLGYDVLTLDGAGQSAIDLGNASDLEQWTTQGGGTWQASGNNIQLEFAEILDGNVTLSSGSQFLLTDSFYIRNNTNSLTVNSNLTGINGPAVTFQGNGNNNLLIVGNNGTLNSNTNTTVLGDAGNNRVDILANGKINGATILNDGNDSVTIGLGASVTGLIDTGAGNDSVISSGSTSEVLLGSGNDSFTITPDTQLLGAIDAGSGDDIFVLSANNNIQQGQFNLSNPFDFEAFAVQAGDWQLTGSTNADLRFTGGQIRITEGDIVSIGGNYSQEPAAWLDITIDQDGIGGLNINGTANLDGGLRLHLADPDIFIVDRFDIIFLTAAEGVTGEFAETDIPVLFPNSMFLSQALEYHPNDARVSYFRSATYKSAAIDEKNPKSVAHYLDHLLTVDRSNDLTEVLKRVDLTTYDEFNRALLDFSSEIYDVPVTYALFHAHQFMRNNHSSRPECHSGIAEDGSRIVCSDDLTIWVKGIYQQFDRDGRNPGYLSYDAKSTGIQAGIDKRLGSVKVGLSGGYTNTDFDTEDNQGDGDGDRYDISLYADWQITNGLYLTGTVGYGHSDNDINRFIELADINRHIDSNSELNHFYTRGDIGYEWHLTNNLSLDTSMGIEYQHIHRDEIKEKGAQGLNLVIEEENYSRVSVNPAVTLEAKLPVSSGHFTTSVRAGWYQHLSGENRDINARFVGANSNRTFEIEGEDDKGQIDLGIDIGYRSQSGLEFGISLNHLQGSRSKASAAGAYFSYSF